MFDRARLFLKSVRQNPFGMPLFLAWAAITVIADGISIVLLSDATPRVFWLKGGWSPPTMEFDTWQRCIMSVFQFGKLFLQGWLIFSSDLRRFLWMIISAGLWGLLMNDFSEHHLVRDGQWGFFLGMVIGEGLIFLKVRRRFWLGAGLAVLLPYVAALWGTAAAGTLQLLTKKFGPVSNYLYVTQDEPIFLSAWTLHTLLTGAVIAWLMPPISKPDET